jgi:hypothetical protein
MQQICTHLNVFHDGQFFVALFERWDEEGYRVCRRVLGPEPSSPTVWEMVLNETPVYGQPTPAGSPDNAAGNPKRRQREAARIARIPAVSTKAQMALNAMREAQKEECAHRAVQDKEQREDLRYRMRTDKRKQKRRGH